MIINASIETGKIDKTRLHLSQKTKKHYLNITLLSNKDGRDPYGNDGMVVQSTTKEDRAKGVRGVILGNYKIVGGAGSGHQPPVAPEPPADVADDQVPF